MGPELMNRLAGVYRLSGKWSLLIFRWAHIIHSTRLWAGYPPGRDVTVFGELRTA